MTLTSDCPAAQPWNFPPAAWPRTQCATQKSRWFTRRRAQGPGGQCQKSPPLLHGPACPQGRVDQRDSRGAQAAGLSRAVGGASSPQHFETHPPPCSSFLDTRKPPGSPFLQNRGSLVPECGSERAVMPCSRWPGTHQPPEALGGHGDVVVNVAGNLLRMGAQGGCNVVPGKPNNAAGGAPSSPGRHSLFFKEREKHFFSGNKASSTFKHLGCHFPGR